AWATRATFAIATCSPATTSSGSRLRASSSSAPSTVSARGSLPAASRRRVYSSSASSPRVRTASTISRTASLTESAAGTSERRCEARPAGPPRRLTSALVRRSSCISGDARGGQASQPGEQLVDASRLELVRDRVGDQPGSAHGDLLAHDEVVLAQGISGRGEVDDGLDHACEGSQLHRALDLDDLGLPSALLEMARGDARVLRGHAH